MFLDAIIDFFADPTGIENSFPAFKAAIIQMEDTGGTLYLPPGVYRIETDAAGLDLGAYLKQRGDWKIQGAGSDQTFLDVYPKLPTFNAHFLSPTAGYNTEISGVSIIGADCEYDPRTQPWCNGIYVTGAVKSGKHIALNDVHFQGVWTYGLSKEGGAGDEYSVRLNNVIFDRALGSAVSVFAGDDQNVELIANDVWVKKAGLPGWNHGAYIHPHVSMHWDRCRFDDVSQYAIKYYSASGAQTIKPRFALIENCTFGPNIQAAIAYHGPELTTLVSRGNTFNCLAFYYGFSVTSEGDTFAGPQACIVGDNVNSTWRFVNAKGVNTKFRIASNNINASGTRIIFDGCDFTNSYIEQTHGTVGHDQTVIVRNLTSRHVESDYLFRPMAGRWQIDGIWVTGTFKTAPWAAPLLTDYGSNIERYSVNNGLIDINRPAIINRSTGANPLITHNIEGI